MRRWIRLALPWAVIGAGTAVLAGCIYIPGSYKAEHGVRPESQIGAPGSAKPLVPGQAGVDDVTRVLGQPTSVSPDGRSMTYSYNVDTGSLVAICGGYIPLRSSRTLLLEFDESGHLRSYEVTKGGPDLSAIQRS